MEITRSKLREFLATVPEDEHQEALQRLKARGHTLVEDPVEQPQSMASAAGQALSETMSEDLPLGVGRAVGQLREGIPGAIAEETGALAEQLGPGLGADAVRALGVSLGGTIGFAGELLPKTGRDLALQAAGGLLSKGVTAAGKALLPPLEQRAPNMVRAVRAALNAQVLPTMAQITQSKPVAAMEEVLGRIPFFGRRIQLMRAAQDDAYNALRAATAAKAGPAQAAAEVGARTTRQVDDVLRGQEARREKELAVLHKQLLDKQGDATTAEAIGKELDRIRMAKVKAANKTAGKLYGYVDEAIPPAQDQVVDGQTKAVAEKFLGRYQNLPNEALDGKARNLLEGLKAGPGERIIENAPDPLVKYDLNVTGAGMQPAAVAAVKQRKAYTFQEMRDLRSTITSLIEQERLKAPPGKTTVEGRIYGKLKDAVDADIEAFGQQLPGEVKAKFEVATAYYRDRVMGRYGNNTIARMGRLAEQNPEDVYRMIVRPGDVSDIRRLKTVVGEAGFRPLRRQFIEELVTGADGAILDGSQINRQLAKYGRATLQEVLTPEQLAQVTRYTQTRQLPAFVESALEKRLRGLIYQSKGVYRAPEEVVRRVVHGDTVTLRAVRRIVGKDGMAPYKRAIVEDIIGAPPPPTALPGQAATPTAQRIGKNLQEYDPAFLKQLFSADELAQIETIDNLKALLESQPRLAANASGTGAALLAPAVSGSVATLAFYNPAAAATVVLSAEVLSRLYTSEAGRKLLIKGLDPKFAKNAYVAGQLSALISRLTMDHINEDRVNKGLSPTGGSRR